MAETRYRVERRVGRLVEARVLSLRTREDADAYGAAVLAETVRASGKPVLCADHRPANVYPPAAAERLVELFRPNNTRFARIAIIVPPTNATLLMQLERLTREAGFENRRVFRDATGALAHLAGVLEESELVRARAFLSEID